MQTPPSGRRRCAACTAPSNMRSLLAVYHTELVHARMQVLPPSGSGGAALDSQHCACRPHLQTGAHMLCNVSAGDIDHDLAPLGLPHIHQAVGIAEFCELEGGRVQAGSWRSVFVLSTILLIHSLSLVGLGHLQAWQGDSCQEISTGLLACTRSQHVRPCALVVPAARQCRLKGALEPGYKSGSARASLSCLASTA